MINATYIGINEAVLFDGVVSEKLNPRKADLISAQMRVRAGYSTYLNSFSVLENQRRSTIRKAETQIKSSLIHCFDSPTKSFKPIRGQIKAGQINLLKQTCPYCLINEWDTLDHYIPKTSFPEYSILVKNLVPCCSQCNKLKDENWRKGGQRRFIHFYNDTFLGNRFLFARITVQKISGLPILKFYLEKPPGISASNFAIVKFHFKDLNLIDRYTSLANTSISSYIDIIQAQVANGLSDYLKVQNVLRAGYTSKVATYGVNYYEAIVSEAFANNTRYLKSFFP